MPVGGFRRYFPPSGNLLYKHYGGKITMKNAIKGIVGIVLASILVMSLMPLASANEDVRVMNFAMKTTADEDGHNPFLSAYGKVNMRSHTGIGWDTRGPKIKFIFRPFHEGGHDGEFILKKVTRAGEVKRLKGTYKTVKLTANRKTFDVRFEDAREFNGLLEMWGDN